MICQLGKEMFKKIILLYLVFFTWNANAMNQYDLEVKIFTNHVVYDVLLNGLPVIKNRSFRDRSLNIPTMGYVRKGKNTLEFNYSVVRSENKKIVHDADESTYFYIGVKNSLDSRSVLSLIEGNYDNKTGDISFSNDDFPGGASKDRTKYLEKIDTKFKIDNFKIGSITNDSTRVIVEFQSDYGMAKELVEVGDEIFYSDLPKIIQAYEKYYSYLKLGDFEKFIDGLKPFYNNLSAIHEVGDYIDFIGLKKDLSAVDSEGFELEPLGALGELTNNNVEIVNGGYLVRIIPAPIRWSNENQSKILSLFFKKYNDEFIPAFISDDFNF